MYSLQVALNSLPTKREYLQRMLEYCRKHLRELQKHNRRRQSDPATHSSAHPKRLSPRFAASLKQQTLPLSQRAPQQQRGPEQQAYRGGVEEESGDELDAFDSSGEGLPSSDDENAEQQQLSASTVERAGDTTLVVPWCELVALLADLSASISALDRLVSTLQRFLTQHNLEQTP